LASPLPIAYRQPPGCQAPAIKAYVQLVANPSNGCGSPRAPTSVQNILCHDDVRWLDSLRTIIQKVTSTDRIARVVLAGEVTTVAVLWSAPFHRRFHF
jgi:hypothetical protein